jgi:hypothetical protein
MGESIMRLWLQAIGAACALSGTATAQQMGPLPGGQVVGSSTNLNLSPAAPRLPAAAPPAGTNIGNPYLRPYDPNKPLDVFKGTGLNVRDVVAPVTGISGTQKPDLLDRLYEKISSMTGFFKPTVPDPMTQPVTPGIFRRNRERNKMEWRRD